MSEIKSIRDFLLILFVIYYSQGYLYPKGSLISQGALGLILAISLFYFIKTIVLTNNKNLFYKAWSLLVILNIIGFILTGTLSNPDHFSMFKGIMMSLLPFYPFYYFSQQNTLKPIHLIRFFIFMLPITILQYFFNAESILSERVSGNTDLVNNVSYSFVALIPFVFFIKRKKIIASGLMLVLIFFIIQGAKRGALIAGAIGLFYYIFYQFRTVSKKNKVRSYFLITLILIGMGYYAYTTFESNQYLISRLETIGDPDGSSGRLIIYTNILSSWYNGSFINHLLGFGFAASLDLSGLYNFAHNDWLELLSNFGLLGVVVYIFLFYSALKFTRTSNWGTDKKILMLAIISMWFFITLVSMAYTSSNFYIQAIIMAYLVGNESKKL